MVNMKSSNETEGLDSGFLVWGFLIGVIAGGLLALFRTPQIGFLRSPQLGETGQALREKIESTLRPADPIAESIAEGKEAARRRRVELGLDA
jgi:gas vesicle protein